MFKLIHKNKIPFFVLVPWLSVVNQPQKIDRIMIDQSKIRLEVRAIDQNVDKPTILKFSNVTIASTPRSREKGLSGRKKKLAPSEAMLFYFPNPTVTRFWMKQTFIPLSVAFFDRSGKLIHSVDMPVEKDPGSPQKIYTSPNASMLALEAIPKAFTGLKPDKYELWIDINQD